MRGGEAGFSLAEALVSMAITAVGVLGVATLFGVGANMQLNTRDSSTSINLVIAEIERLRMLPVTAPERANGGSLTTDVANHFAVDDQVTTRWVIADGPACGPTTWSGTAPVVECTKHITAVAVSRNTRSIPARVEALLWR
jgi:Tfp pilus assembly protein PilV